MIAEFKFSNFFSIKTEQCLSFEIAVGGKSTDDEYCYEVKEGVKLLKLGLIYGANASGKTNILLALNFFRELMIDPSKDKTEAIEFAPFLLDAKTREEMTEFSMVFYLEQERYILSIRLDQKRIYEETLVYFPSTQPAKLYSRSYNAETDTTAIEFGLKLELSKKSQIAILGNTINNSTVLAAFSKSNVEYSKLNAVYDFFKHGFNTILRPETSLSQYVKKQLSNKYNQQLKQFTIKILQESDFNICDLELKEESNIITPDLEKMIESTSIPDEVKQDLLSKGKITHVELSFKHKTDDGVFDLPEEFESRGTIRFMGMAILLYELLHKQKLICVDEVETSLHYELLSYFIKVFLANSTHGSQLIMSTHDINLLNEEFIRRDCVWFAHKGDTGATNLSRLSSYKLHKNVSIYNAYKQNKLAALPFTGSIYLNDEDL